VKVLSLPLAKQTSLSPFHTLGSAVSSSVCRLGTGQHCLHLPGNPCKRREAVVASLKLAMPFCRFCARQAVSYECARSTWQSRSCSASRSPARRSRTISLLEQTDARNGCLSASVAGVTGFAPSADSRKRRPPPHRSHLRCHPVSRPTRQRAHSVICDRQGVSLGRCASRTQGVTL